MLKTVTPSMSRDGARLLITDALVLAVPTAWAQDSPPNPAAHPDEKWGFSWNIGGGGAGGD